MIMSSEFTIKTIGKVSTERGFALHLNKEYIPALKNLDGFSHLQIVWWGNKCDSVEERNILTAIKPYLSAPDEIGIFATRSQIRPNPVLISTVYVLNIDYEKGIIYLPYIDAENDSPIIDIKPYHKSERVEECNVPEWCNQWPSSYEACADFDWSKVFNF